MNRIPIAKEEDRSTVAAILVKNNCTVRQVKTRRGKSNSAYDYYLEYEPNACVKAGGAGDEG